MSEHNAAAKKRFFVPDGEEARIKQQIKYEQVYDGHHQDAFEPSLPSDNSLYIQELIGRAISNTSADMVFGEEVSVSVADKNDEQSSEFLDLFQDQNETMAQMLWEAEALRSYMGGVVIELKKEEEDSTPRPVLHDPRHWHAVTDAMGRITAHVLSFIVYQDTKPYLLKRIHRKGTIETQLYTIDEKQGGLSSRHSPTVPEDMIGLRVPLNTIGLEVPDEEPTGVPDDFLVTYVPNMHKPGQIQGISDYQGIMELMSELNSLSSFAHYILERHSDPIIETSSGVVDDRGIALSAEEVRTSTVENKIVMVDPESKGVTRYVTWDSQLGPLFEKINQTIRSIASYTDMSPGLLGFEEESNFPESGKALRIRFGRTIRRTQRSQRVWERAIKWVLETSQKIMGLEPTNFIVKFSDGIKGDELEVLERLLMERDLNAKSTETIRTEILAQQGYSAEDIEEEEKRIKDEQATRVGAESRISDLFTRDTEIATDGTEQPAQGE